MKKLLLLFLISFFLVGCTQIKDLSISEIVDKVTSSSTKLTNQYRTGYKYYVPRGLRVDDNKEYNEQLSSANYKYYLYIDAVSYYNKVTEDFKENASAYYSEIINYQNKTGYLEIKMYNDEYLIEMMYNYAKIEVIVYEPDIKEAVLNSITILSSIQYNDEIISNLMGDNILEFSEVEVNIFETKKTDSKYIEYDEDYGTSNDDMDASDDLSNTGLLE
jgi:hypothetical protein